MDAQESFYHLVFNVNLYKVKKPKKEKISLTDQQYLSASFAA